jgi:hypothetical protein
MLQNFLQTYITNAYIKLEGLSFQARSNVCWQGQEPRPGASLTQKNENVRFGAKQK